MTTDEIVAEIEDIKVRLNALRGQIDMARPRWYVLASAAIALGTALVSMVWGFAALRHRDLEDIDHRIDRLEIEMASHIATERLLEQLEKAKGIP